VARRPASRLILPALALVAGGCVRASGLVVHPGTGSVIRCDAVAGAPQAEKLVARCLEEAARRGYVPLEKLSPSEEAQLKAAGFVPFSELTAEQREIVERRGVLPRRGL
jgi:hypothetical protein